MKLHASTGLGLLLVVAGTGGALAEDNSSAPQTVPRFQPVFVQADPGKVALVSHEDAAAAAAPPSRLIYLNNCIATGGCTIRPGFESSINDTSSIIEQTANITQFNHPEVWDAIVECVRETYAPFNISVTDQNPGNVPHWENVVAGSPTEAGMQNGVGGVSPYDFGNCSIISNSITYTFANIYQGDIGEICWTVAQETAHSFGLDHEYLQADPMTYIPGGTKRFQNVAAQCGENGPRACNCPWTTQNSVQILTDIFGPATPTPPTVTITEPSFGAQVTPTFVVRATIEDENGLARAQLSIDGQAVGVPVTNSPWVFNASGLAEGTHHVTVTATDLQGTPGEATLDVVVGPPCRSASDCSGQGDNLTCVDGRCVPGEGAEGGLGDTCETGADCLSGQCATNSEGEKYCVEFCDPSSNGCPGDFGCKDVGGGTGVCWPGDGGDGGCQSSSGNGSDIPTLPIGIGLALGALFVRRRTRA